MKKISFIFIIILAFVLPFIFNSNNSQGNVFADNSNVIYISSLSGIREEGNFVLTDDVDYTNASFTPIQSFKGTFNGNGHKIKNLTIQATEGDLAIFLNTQNARIENIQFEHLTVKLTNTQDRYASKVAFLVANAIATTIQNVSIIFSSNVFFDPVTNEEITTTNPSSIEVSSVSSAYVGGIVADAQGGTKLFNCHTLFNSKIDIQNSSKQLYYGGAVAYFDNCNALNIVQDINAQFVNTPTQSCVGGMFGYVQGNKVEIKNGVLTGSVQGYADFPTFIAEISCPNETPNNGSVGYFHTSIDGAFVGNANDLIDKYENNYINFNYENVVTKKVDVASLYLKDYYLQSANFDADKEFNFNLYWQITEKKSLPFLQHFSIFEYDLSENDSFSSLTKPNISSNVIEFLNFTNKFSYMGTINIGGYITNDYSINKFYKIVGLRKDGNVILLNSLISNIIEDEEVETLDGGNTIKYTLGNDVVIGTKVYVSGVSCVLYKLNDSEISWGTYAINNNVVHIYSIDNCTMAKQGTYSFVLDTIKYNVEIRTEDALHGTVRRSTASNSNVKAEIIEDEVFYGQTISYLADATNDFAFNGWKTDLQSENTVVSTQRLTINFNETAFENGGILSNFGLNVEKFTFFATFTKQVCEVKIMFAINGEITTSNLSKVYINDREVTPDANGVISQKIKMGTSCRITITMPQNFEFTNWFLSDGTKNLGVQSEQIEFTMNVAEGEESMVLVANLYQETNNMSGLGSLWWIIGGSVLGVALVGLGIFLIIRKRKDNSYKNMFY